MKRDNHGPLAGQGRAGLRGFPATSASELGAERRAVLLTADDYGTYDYFIGMDDKNLRDMQRIFHGDPDHKCSLLLDYTAAPRSVAGPWYTRNFQRTWDDVQEGCRGCWLSCRTGWRTFRLLRTSS